MSVTITTEHPLQKAQPPEWAAAWGHDSLGPWCEFAIKSVTQRLRWVPPGEFLMGSPDDEDGRDQDEGPQHWVTMSRGFWMFDTPCTQALWKAVTGKEPSKFLGSEHPVEQVSWNDCQEFCSSVNDSIPDINLRLPTEAQWEYACRGGNPDARYGDLDKVAWYSSNSKSKTHDVATKVANPLGLYDMLGNVWEWCHDHSYREYSSTPEADPLFETPKERAFRVVRGGSWHFTAQLVRAACRFAYHPEDRLDSLGFRCLSSPSQASERGGKER